MKKVGFYFGLLWKVVLAALVIISFVFALLFYKIGSLAPGYSATEVAQYVFTENLSNIRYNPTNAPATVPQFVVKKIGQKQIVWARVVTAILGFFTIICFFFIVKSWHTERIAYIATAMYATSSWLLLTARTGNSQILLCFLPLAIVLYVWLEQTKKRKFAALLLTAVLCTLLYIPGGVILVTIALVLRGKHILKVLAKLPVWFLVLMFTLLVIMITPLVIAIVGDHTIIFHLAGLPYKSVTPYRFINNVTDTIVAIMFNSNRTNITQLGTVGLLDVFSIAMFCAGAVYYAKRYKLDRSKYIIISVAIILPLIGLNSLISITILLPLVYLVIAAGLAWFLQQWFTVFPRNPIARTLGVILLVFAVSVSVVFNTYRYFVAWPHMPTTKETYNHRL